MDAGWREVESGEQLVGELGLGAVGVPLLERLILAPRSSEYLRVVADDEFDQAETFDVRVPRTRWYFNVSACRSLRGDVVVALTAFLVTHSVPVAAAAAALRKLGDNLERLSEDELALVGAILEVCPGNPYEEVVAEGDLLPAFDGDLEALHDLLDSMQRKGIVESRRRDRIRLVY